jgi:hypothetical protein
MEIDRRNHLFNRFSLRAERSSKKLPVVKNGGGPDVLSLLSRSEAPLLLRLALRISKTA